MLQDAVNKGDFDAVADEKNAFELFNSGAYQAAGGVAQAQRAVSVENYGAIKEAVASKNAAGLKAAYKKFIDDADIASLLEPVSGQGMSADYDWKARGVKGYVYVR